jgi:branched-chain amino acid transport system ATP-binding protein
MAQAPSLRVEGGVKRFGCLRALDAIDVEIPTQGITAIIGPNGAGKTTLIDALTGFSRLEAGRVFLGHTETTRYPPAWIARLGLARTFQDVRLVWSESVLDNVMVAIRSPTEWVWRALSGRGVMAEERRIRPIADQALQTVGLGDCAEAPASTLSYGQQKLLMLARCLATNARWLVLDEPMAGVAPPLVRKTIAVLEALARDQRSVLFIEHDIQSVRELADNVIFLDRGRVIAAGPTEQVLDRSDLVRAYLG